MATHECKKCLMKTSSNGEIRGSLVTPSSICTAKGHSNEKHHWILVPVPNTNIECVWRVVFVTSIHISLFLFPISVGENFYVFRQFLYGVLWISRLTNAILSVGRLITIIYKEDTTMRSPLHSDEEAGTILPTIYEAPQPFFPLWYSLYFGGYKLISLCSLLALLWWFKDDIHKLAIAFSIASLIVTFLTECVLFSDRGKEVLFEYMRGLMLFSSKSYDKNH